jgi:hypothetical protein
MVDNGTLEVLYLSDKIAQDTTFRTVIIQSDSYTPTMPFDLVN